MKVIIFFLFSFVSLFGSDGIIKPFTSICVEEQAVGFSPVYNVRGHTTDKWKPTKVKSDRKFIIKKIVPNEHQLKWNCPKEHLTGPIGTYGCYKIELMGKKYSDYTSVCKEIWDKDYQEKTPPRLRSILCTFPYDGKIIFKPNGKFNYAKMTGSFGVVNQHDISLSVGTCQKID